MTDPKPPDEAETKTKFKTWMAELLDEREVKAAADAKTKADAEALFQRVHSMVSEGPKSNVNPEALGKLAVLSGVWEFPARVKCATLAWHTLRSALEGSGAPVSTE